ncbi:cell wall-active antibiotics response protein LiaF [Pontibacillus sp. HMF3514]|uniref:cell wall-active antibiotics response protein LiaF n=1 Tax=Pontibacillus sp. HMF3514 TaxID=2692425 RepID=UPI0013203319|nr:cell wall-active antibiotics response protein LiaF [Pontibacillus sp. HMF3514]QHE52640.1 hypothetical protein GS400_11620 [Pontibacillus sp. HMF3514]
MFNRISTNNINWILMIGVILLIIEVVFYNKVLIFSVVIFGIMVYFGWRNFHRSLGKILFWIGIVFLSFTIINMMAVRFIIIIGLILILREYYKSTKEPINWQVPEHNWSGSENTEALLEMKPFMQQRIWGDQITSESAYEWHDVNIQGTFGDRVLDLSNTVLPDHSFISIRHFIGNIEIYVPYEIEVSIQHSSLIGRANILGQYHMNLWNHQLSYQTAHYSSDKPRVKIITSLMSGNIEVKRI